MMTGMLAMAGRFRLCCRKSQPFIRGMTISRRITETLGASFSFSRASIPSEASMMVYWSEKIFFKIALLAGISSTTIMIFPSRPSPIKACRYFVNSKSMRFCAVTSSSRPNTRCLFPISFRYLSFRLTQIDAPVAVYLIKSHSAVPCVFTAVRKEFITMSRYWLSTISIGFPILIAGSSEPKRS